jgi:hypothetical protein
MHLFSLTTLGREFGKLTELPNQDDAVRPDNAARPRQQNYLTGMEAIVNGAVGDGDFEVAPPSAL